MSEEKLSEFARELTERDDLVPNDLIKKYVDQGVPEPEIAAALLARAALAGPNVPQSAMDKSERMINELAQQSGTRPAGTCAQPGLLARIRRFLHIGHG